MLPVAVEATPALQQQSPHRRVVHAAVVLGDLLVAQPLRRRHRAQDAHNERLERPAWTVRVERNRLLAVVQIGDGAGFEHLVVVLARVRLAVLHREDRRVSRVGAALDEHGVVRRRACRDQLAVQVVVQVRQIRQRARQVGCAARLPGTGSLEDVHHDPVAAIARRDHVVVVQPRHRPDVVGVLVQDVVSLRTLACVDPNAAAHGLAVLAVRALHPVGVDQLDRQLVAFDQRVRERLAVDLSRACDQRLQLPERGVAGGVGLLVK